MKTVNSISGGKTSAYLAKHYPADYNLFALVRTSDKNCLFPDAKLRQMVSDKLGVDFIGTLEEDTIIYTMLDLEQFIGSEITWLTGKTFDELIIRGKKKYLPNVVQRFCTTEMKLEPINNFIRNNIDGVCEMRIGYRANEKVRINNMLNRCDKNGIMSYKFITGKSKNGRNKWTNVPLIKPNFPLEENQIFKDVIVEYWKDKPVIFAYMNNCVGCFHRNEMLLKYMSEKNPNKFDWFVNAESDTGSNIRTFKNGISYKQIKTHNLQHKLFDEDFNDCDSGYCGI